MRDSNESIEVVLSEDRSNWVEVRLLNDMLSIEDYSIGFNYIDMQFFYMYISQQSRADQLFEGAL